MRTLWRFSDRWLEAGHTEIFGLGLALRTSHHGGLDLRILPRFQMRLFSMSFDEALEELLVQVALFHLSWLFLESADWHY